MNIITVAIKLKEVYLKKCHNDNISDDSSTTIYHISKMLDKLISQEITGEQAHRWIGWIQAIIVVRGGATLEEMKILNKTDGAFKDQCEIDEEIRRLTYAKMTAIVILGFIMGSILYDFIPLIK